MSEELHIASLVVHALPPRLAAVRRRITALPLARIHGASPAGKLVVTLEGDSAHHIVDQVGAIQRMPGVLGVALVYQHIERIGDALVDAPRDLRRAPDVLRGDETPADAARPIRQPPQRLHPHPLQQVTHKDPHHGH